MSKRIELIGITKLNDCLLKSEYLFPVIKDNDKTPSWDGVIELYKNKDWKMKKSDLFALIDVQVKCNTSSDVYSEQINFSIKKTDLKNYLRGGGVIFFVVRMSDYDNYRIYYETLTPLKLKRYIKNMKNRKSLSILLKTFPKENVEEFTDIFFNFSNDMNKQPSDSILSMNEFEKIRPTGFDSFSMHYHGIQHKNPVDFFLDNEVTIYARHSVANISMPIELMRFTEASHDVNLPIIIDNIEFYSKFRLSHSKDGVKLIIGNSFSFLYPKEEEKAIFNLKFQGTLSQRLKDTKFILALLKSKYFTIGGTEPHDLQLGNIFEGDDFNAYFTYYEEYLTYLSDIKKVLSILNVKEEIDLKNISDKDDEMLKIIISSILHDNHKNLKITGNVETSVFRKNIKICIISLAVLIEKQKDRNYRLTNFFKDYNYVTIQMTSSKVSFHASLFLVLTEDDFLTLSNINYDLIYNSFLKLEANEALFSHTMDFILRMLRAYDKSKKQILLETSLKILDWAQGIDTFTDNEIYLLNKIQILKRMRKLQNSEISQLLDIITVSKNDKILTGTYLLLENMVMAGYHFKRMSENDQNEFKGYPINIFWESTPFISEDKIIT
jgi:hypothetical protein